MLVFESSLTNLRQVFKLESFQFSKNSVGWEAFLPPVVLLMDLCVCVCV